MKVSIITVCFNSASTIRDTLESINSQSYPHIEHIIVDGKSTDGTLEVIHKFGKRIGHLVSEHDSGIYNAMNKGVRLATGEIIGLLNADDVYAGNDVIEKIVACFKTSSAIAVYGNINMVKPNQLSQVIRQWRAGYFSPQKVYHQFWTPPHPGFFVLKKAYDQAGLFDESYPLCADQAFMLKCLLLHKMPWAYLDEYLVSMRVGGASTSGPGAQVQLIREYYRISRNLNIPIAIYSIPLRLLRKFGMRLKSMLLKINS
jgi:glycosyltransferase involved in cell wall biosynthesis